MVSQSVLCEVSMGTGSPSMQQVIGASFEGHYLNRTPLCMTESRELVRSLLDSDVNTQSRSSCTNNERSHIFIQVGPRYNIPFVAQRRRDAGGIRLNSISSSP
jgi:hypothetical protein